MQNNEFDPVQAEKREAALLTGQGLSFEVPKRSFLRFFGKPTRRFTINESLLGTLYALSAQYLEMDFSELTLQGGYGETLSEIKRQAAINAKRCAQVVAIAYLNSHLSITFFAPFYTHYFLWRLTPKTLSQLTLQILEVANMQDFINSIRLLAIQPRMTAPLIEKPGASLEDLA